MGVLSACRERDLSGYDFFNVTKDGFLPVQLASEARLSDVGF
jgi:hypothetical protein